MGILMKYCKKPGVYMPKKIKLYTIGSKSKNSKT